MNVKPNSDTLTALGYMARSAEWERIEAWLIEWREKAVLASFATDPVESRQAQGTAMAIDKFLKETRSAVELSTRR
jgi:hypothetical protein